MIDSGDRIAVLAHGKFPDRAKTATGVLRYGDYDVAVVLDRDRAGQRVADLRADLPDAPIVASMADAPAVDALVIGIAPIGGGFDDSWRSDVRTAIERGCDVVAGLHYFLADDTEFADLAAEHGVSLHDVRRPPEDLGVATGRADEVDAEVVLTVGTDCSTGKMTTTFELARAARERGIDAGVVPTGQTGILIEGRGVAVDRVVADFAAGAVERMVTGFGADHDVLFVEGQGSLVHPAYSGVTLSILHGAAPDALVLCHAAGREVIHGYEDTRIPPVGQVAKLYEDVAAPVGASEVVAGALNTASIDPADDARAALSAYAADLGVPAADPVRVGPDPILDALALEG